MCLGPIHCCWLCVWAEINWFSEWVGCLSDQIKYNKKYKRRLDNTKQNVVFSHTKNWQGNWIVSDNHHRSRSLPSFSMWLWGRFIWPESMFSTVIWSTERKRSSQASVTWKTNAAHGDMSRLFSTYGFCARSSRLAFRKSSVLSKHGAVARVNPPTAFMQQQRRCIGRSNAVLVRLWSRSRIWICGVGLGVAVAVGLKCRSDAASDLCDDNFRSDRRSERYSDAIKVSRDLVERIQVRAADRGSRSCL